MQKRIFVTLLALALALLATACRPSQTAVLAPTLTASSAPAPAATESPAPQAAASQVPPGCTVVSIRPTPGPTEQSLFPPVTEKDWVKGPGDAYITIIEYGDYM